jgi:hypothetical protein
MEPSLQACLHALDTRTPAAQAAADAIQAAPSSPAAQFHYALALLLEKKFRKSLRAFKSLQLPPDVQGEKTFYMAIAEFSLQLFEDAALHFREVYTRSPQDGAAADYLAQCYTRLVH